METQQRSAGLAEQIKQDGRQRAERGKDAAAHEVEQLADVLDQAGSRLSDGQPTLASYATRMADGLDGLAQRIRGSSLEDLARDTRQAAIRNPGTYLLASAAVGFLAARFLKATADESTDSTATGAMRTGSSGMRSDDFDPLSTPEDDGGISSDMRTRSFPDAPEDFSSRPQ